MEDAETESKHLKLSHMI